MSAKPTPSGPVRLKAPQTRERELVLPWDNAASPAIFTAMKVGVGFA